MFHLNMACSSSLLVFSAMASVGAELRGDARFDVTARFNRCGCHVDAQPHFYLTSSRQSFVGVTYAAPWRRKRHLGTRYQR